MTGHHLRNWTSFNYQRLASPAISKRPHSSPTPQAGTRPGRLTAKSMGEGNLTLGCLLQSFHAFQGVVEPPEPWSERPLAVGRPLLVLGFRIWLAESFARLKSTAAGRAGWNGSETTGTCRSFTGGRSRALFCGDDAAATAA